MPISYAAALRMLAKERGHFSLPKKGSDDYEKVRQLMIQTEMSAEHEVKKRATRVTKAGKVSGHGNPLVTGTDAPPPMKVDTTIIDNPPASDVKEKKVRNAAKKPVIGAKGGVKRSGRTKAEESMDAQVNGLGTAPSTVITTQNPDQKKAIKKSLSKKEAKLSVNANPAEQTIDVMNKEATGVSVDGDKQFSFIDFRKKLLC